eukprot:GEMP01049369.1.p1 GENE.GEMP01049369.1~~GEMP01049369.1.p1  ORF type:complete len:320 (+),score=60.07 GEMP01049369.1:75-1034(+)
MANMSRHRASRSSLYMSLDLTSSPSTGVQAASYDNEYISCISPPSTGVQAALYSAVDESQTPAPAMEEKDAGTNDEDTDSDDSSYESEIRDEIPFESIEELEAALRRSHVNVDAFGTKSAKSLNELFWELYKRECKLVWVADRLQRHNRVMKIYLYAQTKWGTKVLTRICEDIGEQRRDLWKLARPVTKQMYFNLDDDEESFQRVVLHNRCGLPEKVQQTYIEFLSRSEYEEGPISSYGYPGLPTHYVIIVRHLRITDIHGEGLQAIGLPSGSDFQHVEQSVPGCRRNYWSWKKVKKAPDTRKASNCARLKNGMPTGGQ